MRSLNPWPIFPSNLDAPVARSLSIQFILQGLIVSFDLLRDLQVDTPTILKNSTIKDGIVAISKRLEKLLLFSLANPFTQKSSSFDKLCFYSEILLQASHIKSSEILMILEEIRNSVLKTKSKILSWKKIFVTAEEVSAHFFDLYNDLFQKLSQFFNALTVFLKETRGDENILIYLVENKDQLNAYLGPRKIEDLLQSFFPAGYDQLRAVIQEGYSRRGFDSFLDSVQPLIDALE